jgi:hypothetical protein
MDPCAFPLLPEESMIERKHQGNPPVADLFALVGKHGAGRHGANLVAGGLRRFAAL